MGVLRQDEFESHIKRRLASTNGLLIHGNDEAAVSLLGRQAAKAIGGEVLRVDSAAAKAAPGTFMDDFLALTLLGERQVLWLDGADEACLKFLEPVFAYKAAANFVIALSQSLGKTSKLRAAAESSSLISALALYEEDEAKLKLRLRAFFETKNQRFSTDAEAAFLSATGADRAMIEQEAEKLSLYMLGRSEITASDVLAICGNMAEFTSDELIDRALAGNLEQTDQIISQSGAETRNLLALMQLHLNLLHSMRAEMERGASAEAAIASAKPPIFFKRKPALLQQLRKFSTQDLLDIQEVFSTAIFQSRRYANLSEAVISRALLTIARLARVKSI